MFARIDKFFPVALFAILLAASPAGVTKADNDDGVVRVKSA